MSEVERVEGEPATQVEIVVRDSESEPASPLIEEKHNHKADQKLLDATNKWQEDEDEVEEWLCKGADPNARSTDNLSTPLHNAAGKGYVNIVRTLLSRGADPNAARSDQWTPLHVAANKDQVECLRLLLKRKAALNALNDSHQTPLNLAAAGRRRKATDFLLEQAGVDVNISDDRQKTALHNACAAGWADTVETLLGKGALADTQDDIKRVPIHYAATASNLRVVRSLLAVGISVNVQDKSKITPLHEASARGDADIVEMLIANGASVNMHDRRGKTPLHVASAHNRARVVNILLAHGADVNVVAHDGCTSLHEALRFGATHAADRLLAHGAEPSMPLNTQALPRGTQIAASEPPWDEFTHTVMRRADIVEGIFGSADDNQRREVRQSLQASVWPWPPRPFILARPTVQQLLDEETSPILGKADKGAATWIHLPANNRAWVEDVFKILYASQQQRDEQNHDTGAAVQTQEDESETDESVSSSSSDSTGWRNSSWSSDSTDAEESDESHDAARIRKLLSILAFIKSQFNGIRTETARQTEQGFSDGGIRSFSSKYQTDNMVALALPIIDIDLRQYYYDRTKAQEVERKAAGNGTENGGPNKENKTKVEKNAEADAETAILEKIKEYTVDDGGLPVEAESSYLQLMAKLRAAYGHQVDVPVSLDEYFHESIGEIELNVRNGDQVISRFIARQRAEADRITTELQNATGATEQGPQHDKSPGQLEAGLGDQPQTAAVTDQFCQRILTVPRFWIWKLDKNTVVTSFPQRWDETGRQGCLAREIWMALIEKVLDEQKFRTHEIRLDVDDLLAEIAKTCLQFRPSFRLMGKVYTYPDVFASEVAFVSRQVTSLYRQYRNALGHSVGDFSRSIKLATECLITVDDILSELTMIKRVYRDQGRAMLLLKTGDRDKPDPDGSLNYDTVEWGYEGLRSTMDKHIIARLKHLEKDAQMVRKSITTLLDLRQRQVAIESALSSEAQSDMLFKQSSILFIFTLATVLFAPLSWVAALMALKINDFTPESEWWSQSRVAGASGGGMSLITSPRMAHVVADSQDSLLSSGIEPEAFYEVEIPGKGSGLIANRTIRKGEIIMQRAPALLIQNHPHIDFEPGLRLEMYQAAVDRLPEPTRTNFLRQTGDTIYEKVQKNSFRVFVDGDTQHSAHLGIFPEVSKFNHDCRPNVHYRISNFTHTTVAVRDIPAGEELTVSYIYGMVPRAERLEQLREWGFTCSCPQCALSDRESSASDNRIRQIKMLEDEIESLMSAAASNRRRRRQRGSGAEGGGAEGNEDVALRPEMGSKLVELYLEERLDAYLTPAYTRAALLYSMFGHEERAQNYAREAVGALEREKGPRAGSLPSMRRLAENPRAHWSWGVMVTSGEAGGTRDKKNQTGGRGVRA
ncbi:hypothetical protein C7999DRAFT_30983 [Corynascus novoguineensis]|uniref:SET domain-containing protein n=1 Tax=Corynascus novoguineensis TaxID=1126955 RepID=A0AAN7CUM0_9PEZI|nr:hypothetical protein C7999DRAFT_30983 [Corynascus novoguineensis]